MQSRTGPSGRLSEVKRVCQDSHLHPNFTKDSNRHTTVTRRVLDTDRKSETVPNQSVSQKKRRALNFLKDQKNKGYPVYILFVGLTRHSTALWQQSFLPVGEFRGVLFLIRILIQLAIASLGLTGRVDAASSCEELFSRSSGTLCIR